jgi:cytochrome c biogenesis protein CcdA
MTCVFVGIAGTLLSMFYDLYFVEFLQYPLSSIINVATLIFGVNLVFLVIGFLFYGFTTFSRYGERVYIIVFILMTGFFIWKMQGAHRTDNDLVNLQFRYLSSGIIIILGLLASVAVPFLFHNKQFNKYVV